MKSLNSFHNSKICLTLLLCLLLCASGCTEAPAQSAPDEVFYTFTDSTGASVVLPQKPQKCAVLFSSFAEIWTRTGGTVCVTVGESVERGFADEKTLLADGGAGKTINEEILLTAECDFVIGSADIPAQVQAVSLLRQRGIPCALFSVESFEEYLYVLRIFADLNENDSVFDRDGTQVQNNIRALLEALPAQTHVPQVLFIRSGSSAASAKAKTADQHFAAAMLEHLGAHNIADDVPVLTDSLSIEEVLLRDPDIIIISCMGDEDAAKKHMNTVLQSPAWKRLTAVQTGSVHYLPKDLFQYKPNHRWDEAYQYLSNLLYQDLPYQND